MRGGMNSEKVEGKEEEKVIEERRNVKERLGKRDSYVSMELCETFFILPQLYDITVWSRTIMRVENMKILLGIQ